MSGNTANDIAIIGISCRFPKAKTLREFWANLLAGTEGITFFSDEELLAAGVDPALLRDPNYVKARGIVSDIDQFDAPFFGFHAREAELTDPQHRLFLECAWEAFEDAGYDPEGCQGHVGVFAGVDANGYLLHNLLLNPTVRSSGLHLQLGNDKDFLATRVSYKLNLTGPSLTVQTACSTSLVAVHLACQSLLNGECDTALAGGAGIIIPQIAGQQYQEGGIISPDGYCRPFDTQARGTVRGSGVGTVLLKRLDDALADRDHIYAVIKGSAINNDGSAKVGFTAPSVDGQSRVIVEAQVLAGVDPDSISYVESHGTGTKLGDPIEVAALTQAYRTQTERKQFCGLGAVKASIGHLGAAAGVAGLIKTVMALKEQVIPPTLHFTAPNEEIDFANSPFYVVSEVTPWPKGDAPRRAGVSSFGLGGTNAHVVLEEAPARVRSGPSRPWRLLTFSARTEASLDAAQANLLADLEQNPDLADVAYTLQVGRRRFGRRRFLVCRDTAEAQAMLAGKEPLAGDVNEHQDRPVVFLFPGQGAQYADMARGLYEREPLFRKQVDRCAELLRPHLGLDLRTVLFPAPERAAVAAEQLNLTGLAQPALFVIEYALAQLWLAWGITPKAMIGHSVGEYVAACLAGVFSLEDGLALVATRGRLMQSLPAGAMLAVPLPAAEVEQFLEDEVSLAAVNGPSQCVVAGQNAAVEALEQRLTQRGIACRRLHTSHAFHSAMMEPVLAAFAERVRQVALQAPQIPYVSNVSGAWITPAEATSPDYWAQHLRQTVRFHEGVQELLREPNGLFLEVGPGRTLSTLLRQSGGASARRVVLSSVRHPHDEEDDQAFLLKTLGRLWSAGARIDWKGFYGDEERNRLSLSTYPFDRKRYWVEGQPLHGLLPDQMQPIAPVVAAAAAQSATAPYHTRPELAVAYAAPSTDLERTLAALWEELFGVAPIGIHDDFFELDGDSLLAVRLVNRVRETLQVDVPVAALFRCPTVSGLARLIAEAGGVVAAVKAPTMERIPRVGWLKTSYAQERMWRYGQVEPFRYWQHNDTYGWRLRGPLDTGALERVLNELVRRHEVLRTVFTEQNDEVRQEVRPFEPFELPQVDLRGTSERLLKWSRWPEGPWSPIRLLTRRRTFDRLRRVIDERMQDRYDLTRDRLFRPVLCTIAADDHALLISTHRITSDGWSRRILQQELIALYEAYRSGKPSPLPEPSLQYADLAAWQRRWFDGQAKDERLAYWQERLAGNPFDMALPQDRERPSVPQYRTAHSMFKVDPETTNALAAVGRRTGATMFMLLLATFKQLLRRHAGRDDILVAVPVHNRHTPDLQRMFGRVGMLLCMRTDLTGADSHHEVIRRVRSTALEADRNALPWELLLRELMPKHLSRYMPPYRAMFNFYDLPDQPDPSNLSVQVDGLPIDPGRLDADLDLVVRPDGDELDVDLRYDPEIFDQETIAVLAADFRQLLRELAADPEQAPSAIQVPKQERRSAMEQSAKGRGMSTFLVVLIGQIISMLGSNLARFGLGIWVYQSTGSTTQFALISMFMMLPSALMAPLAGALVDRWDRRKALILSDVGSGLSTLALVALVMVGRIEVWHIYVASLVSAIFGAIRWPALQASITTMLPREQYGRANGMLQLGQGITQIVAPFLGAFLLGGIGLNGIVTLDLITFAIAIVTLFLVTIPQPYETEEGKAARGSILKEMAFGWTYITQRPGLLGLLILFMIANFNLGIIQTLIQPLILSFTTLKVLGTILSVAGLGVVIGGLFMSLTGGPRRRIVAILGGALLQGIVLTFGGLKPSVVLVAGSAFAFLFCSAVIMASSQALWQIKVAPDVQGRVFATRTAIALLSSPISYAVAGPLADNVFGPLLLESGALADTVGKVIGVGPGRGIGFLFVILGLATVLLVVAGYLYRPLRNVETDLPDVGTPPRRQPVRANSQTTA